MVGWYGFRRLTDFGQVAVAEILRTGATFAGGIG